MKRAKIVILAFKMIFRFDKIDEYRILNSIYIVL